MDDGRAEVRSRARKSAENKIQTDRLGQFERLRRAVDCAPYQRSAPLGRDWRAAILAVGLLRPGRSRAGVDWSAAILAAVNAVE